MKPWKTQSRKTILKYGKFLTVEGHCIQLPDGKVIQDWPWIITPEYVIVLALTKEGYFLCFRQTKYAVDGTSMAPVGGYIEPGEKPLSAAKRELLEETGHEADTWTSLGNYSVDGNYGGGMAHLYLALNAVPVAEPNADDLEEQELLHLAPCDVDAALMRGEFKVLAWALAVALALRYL